MAEEDGHATIPLSVQAERNVVDENHNSYSNQIVNLHDDELVTAQRGYYCNPISINPTKVTLDSVVSHKHDKACAESEDADFMHYRYDVNSDEFDLFYVIIIIKPEISRSLIDCYDPIPKRFDRIPTLPKSPLSIVHIIELLYELALALLQEYAAVFKITGNRSPFVEIRSKNRPHNPHCFKISVHFPVGIYSKYKNEIIRFLLWINQLTRHFRELKVLPPMVSIGDCKNNEGEEYFQWKNANKTTPSTKCSTALGLDRKSNETEEGEELRATFNVEHIEEENITDIDEVQGVFAEENVVYTPSHLKSEEIGLSIIDSRHVDALGEKADGFEGVCTQRDEHIRLLSCERDDEDTTEDEPDIKEDLDEGLVSLKEDCRAEDFHHAEDSVEYLPEVKEDPSEAPVPSSRTVVEEYEPLSPLCCDTNHWGYEDSMYYGYNMWFQDASYPMVMICPEDDCTSQVLPDYRYVAETDEEVEDVFAEVDTDCNILALDGKFLSDRFGKSKVENTGGIYLFQEPDGFTSVNVVEELKDEGCAGFSSTVLVVCLSLLACVQGMKKVSIFDSKCGNLEVGRLIQAKTFKPYMSMKHILQNLVLAWLLVAVGMNMAAPISSNIEKSLNSDIMDPLATCNKKSALCKGTDLMNILYADGSKIFGKAAFGNDKKMLEDFRFSPGFSNAWEAQIVNQKKDFLRDVLNIPDCLQPQPRTMAVYPVFEQRGYEDELRRIASFSKCSEENWIPAVPLAENGYHFEPDASIICHFCKSKTPTWQKDWNPKQKHAPNCPFLSGQECGNIPMKPSTDNGKYQPAVQIAIDDLQLAQLQKKTEVLLRNSKRSVDTFKNPQLPEDQMESLSITNGQQENDALETDPQPSTSNSNTSTQSQQPQDKASGLRYFVHTYDERGQPISTSQKMEFNSKEERANVSMKKEIDRFKTFTNVWKKSDVISPVELAKAGFYYAGTGDRVRCAFCNGVLRNWAIGDNATTEHRRHYPTCPLVLNLDVGNEPHISDLSGLQTSTPATTTHPNTAKKSPAAIAQRPQSAQRNVQSLGPVTPALISGTISIPKHSNFSTAESRMLTYDAWPTTNVQSPNELAVAGFFYTGLFFLSLLRSLCRGLAVTSRDDVIDRRPPYWRYFFGAALDVLMEITLENGRKIGHLSGPIETFQCIKSTQGFDVKIWKVFIYLH
jgi:hypothetical protein